MATVVVQAMITIRFESDTDPSDSKAIDEMREELQSADGAMLDLMSDEGFEVGTVVIKVTDV